MSISEIGRPAPSLTAMMALPVSGFLSLGSIRPGAICSLFTETGWAAWAAKETLTSRPLRNVPSEVTASESTMMSPPSSRSSTIRSLRSAGRTSMRTSWPHNLP